VPVPLGWLGEVHSEKKHTSTDMNSTQKEEIILPSQGVRVPQGTADELGIVPAQPLSSSGKGLPQVLAAGICEERITADENEESHESIRKAEPSRPSSQMSIRSTCSTRSASNVPMDTEKERENRKRSRKDMQQQEESVEEKVEDKVPLSQRVKKGKHRVTSGEEDEDDFESIQKKRERCAEMIIVSDNENADCSAGPLSRERGKGEEDGRGKDEVVTRNPDGSVTVMRQGNLITLKKRGRKKKIRRQALGVEKLGLHELEDTDDSEGYDVLSAPEMGATAIEYLEDVEKIRVKCGNIKGKLSGIIQKRISKSKEIIKGLVKTIEKESNRQEGGEEVGFLKMRNEELKARLKEKERDNYNREKEIEQLHKVIKELREELNALKEKVANMEKKEDRGERSPKRKKVSNNGVAGKSSTYRRDRTIDASMNKRETSAADDSDITVYMEEWDRGETGWRKDDLPVTETTEFKPPYPAKDPYPGPSRITDPGPREPHHGPMSTLERKKKEELMESQYIREKIKRDDTLGKVEGRKRTGNVEYESPQASLPQRQPRVSKPNIRLLGNVVVKPTEESKRLIEERKRLIEKNKEIIKRKEQAAAEKAVKSTKEEVGTEGWLEQKSRKERRKEKKKITEESQKKVIQTGKHRVKRKPPRSSAVTVRANSDFTYAEVLRGCRTNFFTDRNDNIFSLSRSISSLLSRSINRPRFFYWFNRITNAFPRLNCI